MLVKTSRIMALWSDRRGITALEYGIMAGWLTFIIIGAFARFGTEISTLMSGVASSM